MRSETLSTKSPDADTRHRSASGRTFGSPLALVWSGYVLAFDACYLIATSRWGSYVGIPHHPIYIGDLLFGLGAALWLLGGGLARLWNVGRREPLVWLTVALVAWVVVRLAVGTVNTVALRDAAPYVYLLAIPLLLTTPVSGRVFSKMLIVALAVHVAYVAVQLQDHSLFLHMPKLGPTRAFDLRDDFDEAVEGVGVALGIATIIRGSSALRRVAGAALTGVACWDISQMSNRGGLLAAAAAVVAAAAALTWDQLRTRRREPHAVAMAGLGLALCAATSIAFLQSPALHRLNNTFYSASSPSTSSSPPTSGSPTGSPSSQSPGGSSASNSGSHNSNPHPVTQGSLTPTPAPTNASSSNQAAADAAGTTRARRVAWEDVYRYTTRTASRTVFGVGFGPNFLQAAGAQQLLSGGTPGLRAPHDILLNTWARLGLIGLVLNGLLLALSLIAAARYVLKRGVDAGLGPVLLIVALPVAALVGVILESPFGAIPFAVAVGWIASAFGARASAYPR